MIVTQSVKMQSLIRFARRVAASTAPVLITGESGTGKELFAQLVHDASSRTSGKLVRVNCAALSSQLVESELFGHEKGAFTDAVTTRIGRFEAAHLGSILLDEISEVPSTTQAKLLRVIESGEYERVGSNHPLKHDVRFIAASNRELVSEVKYGNFRLDLFHRINVVEIKIPSLRDRPEDIPVLAMHFVQRFKCENALWIKGFTKEAMRRMSAHSWPGNVRELRNVVHRACILSENELINCDALQLAEEIETRDNVSTKKNDSTATAIPDHWLTQQLVDVEREIILAAINKYGNRMIVAQKLGVSPRTLTNKMRQYRESQQRQSERQQAA